MDIKIYQGHRPPLEKADVNIVIDVIRAFTVAHYAFVCGVQNILLVASVEEAFELKEKHEEYLLAGEISGLPILGFDLDNSPVSVLERDISGRMMVQKTTNGVESTLHALNADSIYVTGFSNARTTGEYIRNTLKNGKINIIASHPTGDDDLACAQYIESLIRGTNDIDADTVKKRIRNSHVAHKFFDRTNLDFQPEDVLICMKEIRENFVMKINKQSPIPMIERLNV